LYFIITNFHKELKPLVEVNHDMNSLAFVVHYTQRLINQDVWWTILLWSGSTKSWSTV